MEITGLEGDVLIGIIIPPPETVGERASSITIGRQGHSKERCFTLAPSEEDFIDHVLATVLHNRRVDPAAH